MMDYVKSVIEEKMQVWMNIMIKYFTLPVSTGTASSLDAQNNWNFYAPIQDIFHKNTIHLKKLVYRNLSILAPKHHCRSLWPLNMIPCYFNQKMMQLERNGKTKFLGKRAHTIPFWDGVLESFKTSGGRTRSNRRFVICYIWPTNQVNILSSWNSLASSDNDKFSWGNVSVGNNCSSLLYRQNFELLFRFKNVEHLSNDDKVRIWTG